MPTLFEIHPITETVIDPQLGDSFANWLGITGVSGGEPLNPDLDTISRLDVAKFIKPMRKRSNSYFNNEMNVATWLHIVNDEFVTEGAPNVQIQR